MRQARPRGPRASRVPLWETHRGTRTRVLSISSLATRRKWVAAVVVEGFETELGYFSLDELAEATVFGSVPAVERDLYWKPMTLGEIRRLSYRVAAW